VPGRGGESRAGAHSKHAERRSRIRPSRADAEKSSAEDAIPGRRRTGGKVLPVEEVRMRILAVSSIDFRLISSGEGLAAFPRGVEGRARAM